jgi:hypothetical protein
MELMQNRGNRIGDIPSGPESNSQFFDERKAYYARYDLDLSVSSTICE